MAVNLSPVGGVAAQFFTNTSAPVPLNGGKIFTYAAGTTTPQVAYTTSQGNIAWSNPIVLNSAGRVPGSGEIWLTDGLIYKFVLKDSSDVLIATYDNIVGINGNLNAQQVSYTPLGVGAVTTNVQAKLRETVSVKDFGAVGNGVANDTAAIQTALNSGARKVIIPATSVCLFNGNITVPSNVSLIGPGALKPASTTVYLSLANNNSVVDSVEFVGDVQDSLYTVAVNGVTSYFSNSSLVTGGGALSSVGGVAGNDLTLGFVTDSGTAVTEVFSSQIPINSGKRYVVQLLDDFVKSGFVAGEMKVRVFDNAGNPIVGNSSITVDASGYYNYTLPLTYASGNYLFFDGASFVQFIFAVQRDANQQTGNTCVFDMSKVQLLELTNFLATSPKSSLDNVEVVRITGDNNVVKNCYFHNLPNLPIFDTTSNGTVITNNTIYNCLSGIGINTTFDSTVTNNIIVADFEGYGNRAYRWKAIAGVNNTRMTVSHNTAKGFFWGYELIRDTSNLYPDCAITHNHVDAISAPMSLSGYEKAVIAHNTCIGRDLSYFMLEFPEYNLNCEIANNTLIANTEMTLSVGISGLGGKEPTSSTRVVNNRIKAAIGMTCIYSAPAGFNDNFGLVIAGNTIEYGSTALFSNISDIRVENNTAFPITKGSNQLFGVRSAFQLPGVAMSYTTYALNNNVTTKDSYAFYGQNVRNLIIDKNKIIHDATACSPIYYLNPTGVVVTAKVINNEILTSYNGYFIQFINAPQAGSRFTVFGNTNGTTKINVNGLPLSSSFIQPGSDPLVYQGTMTPSAGTFSKTVDVVRDGSYWLTALVHNGDYNHSRYSFNKQYQVTGTVNTMKALTNIQTATDGTLVTALTVATSSGSIVISGTNDAGLDGTPIPYYVEMTPASQ